MYTDYWKLNSKPFENVSDARFMYYSEQHREALARLLYAVREKKSGAFVAGPYGVGKTMVRDILVGRMAEMSEGEIQRLPVSIENPVCGPVGMLQLLRTRIAEEVQVQAQEQGRGGKDDWSEWLAMPHSGAVSAAHEFNQLHRLLNRIAATGRHVVLLLDQAHLVHSVDTLEQLTMLMNLQFQQQQGAVTILFFGHETIIPFIRQHTSFMQRVPCRWHIHPLSDEQTVEYISHRLKVAGLDRKVFTREALNVICKSAGGIAREINNICDFALFLGSSAGAEFIDGDLVQQVCQDAERFSTGAAIA